MSVDEEPDYSQVNDLSIAVSAELRTALGEMVLSFQALEVVVCFSIWELVSPNQRIGQALTSQLPFRRLIDLFAALFRLAVEDEEAIQTLKALRARGLSLEAERNALIHSWWAVSEAGDATQRMKIGISRSVLTIDFEDVEAGRVRHLARELRRLGAEFIRLRESTRVQWQADTGFN